MIPPSICHSSIRFYEIASAASKYGIIFCIAIHYISNKQHSISVFSLGNHVPRNQTSPVHKSVGNHMYINIEYVGNLSSQMNVISSTAQENIVLKDKLDHLPWGANYMIDEMVEARLSPWKSKGGITQPDIEFTEKLGR
jgi:hypothetical protein